jgi:hypothetical protein
MLRKLMAIATITLGMAGLSRGETYFVETGQTQDTDSSATGHATGDFHIQNGVITDSLGNDTGYKFNLDLTGDSGFNTTDDGSGDLTGTGTMSGNFTIFTLPGDVFTVFSTGTATTTAEIDDFLTTFDFGDGPVPVDILTHVTLSDLTLASTTDHVIPFIDSAAVSLDAQGGQDGGFFFSGGPINAAVVTQDPPVAPLPKSADAGLGLIGAISAAHLIRKRRPLPAQS